MVGKGEEQIRTQQLMLYIRQNSIDTAPAYGFKDNDHRKENPFFTIENRMKLLKLIERIKPIAEDHQVTVAQLVINWTMKLAK